MSFSYIDIHAHLNFAAFEDDRDEVITRTLEGGVAMINVGTHYSTSKKAVELAEKYEKGVYAIVGLHPVHTGKSFHDIQEVGEGGQEFTSKGEEFDTERFRTLLANPKVVGIGECGLDYYRIEDDKSRSTQEKAFRSQIELAISVKKPLMLHLRNGSGRSAYTDAFSILNSYAEIRNSSVRGNLHFFAGSIDEAQPFLDRGFTFSFTGVITFPPRSRLDSAKRGVGSSGEAGAKEYAELVRYLPLDRILSETDSPYVAPVPYRGTRNEPRYVEEVVKAVAFIKNERLETVRERIKKNAEELFTISLH